MSRLQDCMINRPDLTVIIAGGKLVHLDRHATTLSITEVFDILAKNEPGMDDIDIKEIRGGADGLFEALEPYGVNIGGLADQYVEELQLSHKMYEITGGDEIWKGGLYWPSMEAVCKKHSLSRAICKEVSAHIGASSSPYFPSFSSEFGAKVLKSAGKFKDSDAKGKSWAKHRAELYKIVKAYFIADYNKRTTILIRQMREREIENGKL